MTARRIRAVGFDLDDTLFDHRGAARAGARRFLTGLGATVTEDVLDAWSRAEDRQYERWRSGAIGFQEQRRERLRIVLPALGLALPTAEDALDALFDDYLVAYRDAWRVFPDVIPLLGSLRERGYLLGLLTNGSAAQQHDKLARTGLVDAFDAVCVSEEIGVHKPGRRAFTTLADRLGVDPGACLFVGDDVEKDIAGAGGAGMRTAHVDRTAGGTNDLAELVDAALGDD